MKVGYGQLANVLSSILLLFRYIEELRITVDKTDPKPEPEHSGFEDAL